MLVTQNVLFVNIHRIVPIVDRFCSFKLSIHSILFIFDFRHLWHLQRKLFVGENHQNNNSSEKEQLFS
jgi:hypothetical protein